MAMMIGYLMAGFTPRKQALHDYMAGTLVVDRWAYTASPEKQERGLSGCVIVFIVFVVGFALLFVVMMAVAVSQFEAFRQRAGSAALEPQGSTVCFPPASSPYVARCRPPSFEA
jgi:hypothetical protein